MKGIDPIDLMAVTLKRFQGKGIPDEVAEIKFDHYERRRKQKIDDCMEERAAVIRRVEGPANDESEEGEDVDGQAVTPTAVKRIEKSASAPMFRSEKPKKSLLERELARMEKVKARQKAEIDGILAHERHLLKLHEEAAIKEEKDHERQEVYRRKREQAAEERAAKKAEMEMKKHELEMEEEARAKEMALKQFKQSQRLAELQRQGEIQNKKTKERNERERIAKAAIRRKRTQQILQGLEEKADERMRKLEEADRRRNLRLTEERALALQKTKQKSEESARRIKRAMDAAQKELDDKRARVAAKNEMQAAVREERNAEKQAMLEKMISSNRERQENRKELLEDVYLREKDRIRRFEQHLKEQTGNMAAVEAGRAKERAIYKAKRDLKVMDKMDNVARQMRMAEYKRLRTLQKLENEEERRRQIAYQKKLLQDNRKKDELESMRRKYNLKRSMDYIRATAKWNLIEYLDDHGKINRRKRRGGKKKNNDEDEEDGGEKRRMAQTS
jgi:hypothetical protein